MRLINLMPSKKSQINSRQLDIIVISVTVLLPMIITIIFYMVIQHKKIELEENVSAYSAEIQSFKRIDDKIKLTDDDKEAKQSLRATVKLWQLLSDLSGQPVCVQTVERVKNKLMIEGMAHSVYELEAYVKKLSASNLVAAIYIDKLMQLQRQHTIIYRLHLSEAMQSRVR